MLWDMATRRGRAIELVIPYIDLSNLAIAGVRVHVFGLLLVTAIWVGHTALVRRGRVLGVATPGEVEAFAVVTVGAGILVAYAEGWVRGVLGVSGERAGLDLRGFDVSSAKGFAAAIAAGGVFVWARRLDARRFADLSAYAFPFALFFARMGCAAAHDHPGRPSDAWLAVRFPTGPRLDMGLLEWLSTPLLIGLVVLIARRTSRPGVMAGALALAYSMLRFGLDFFRAVDLGPRSDPRFGGLTAAQWLAVPLFCGGIFLLITAPRAKEGPGAPASRPAG